MGKCGVGGGAEKNMVWYRNRSGSIRGYALFVPGSGSFFIGLDAGFYGAAGSKMDGTQMEDPEGNPLAEPRTPQMEFRMKLPKPVPAWSILRHAVALSGK